MNEIFIQLLISITSMFAKEVLENIIEPIVEKKIKEHIEKENARKNIEPPTNSI